MVDSQEALFVGARRRLFEIGMRRVGKLQVHDLRILGQLNAQQNLMFSPRIQIIYLVVNRLVWLQIRVDFVHFDIGQDTLSQSHQLSDVKGDDESYSSGANTPPTGTKAYAYFKNAIYRCDSLLIRIN